LLVEQLGLLNEMDGKLTCKKCGSNKFKVTNKLEDKLKLECCFCGSMHFVAITESVITMKLIFKLEM